MRNIPNLNVSKNFLNWALYGHTDPILRRVLHFHNFDVALVQLQYTSKTQNNLRDKILKPHHPFGHFTTFQLNSKETGM